MGYMVYMSDGIKSKEELKEKIALGALESNEKSEKAKQEKIEEVSRLYHAALGLMPEVRDLCELVNTAIEYGFAIEDSGSLITKPLKGCPQLLTDGIFHKLGFYGKSMVGIGKIYFNIRYDKIGYKNGGCDGNFDFYTDGYDIYFGQKSFKEYDPDFVMFARCGSYWTKGVEQLKSFLRDFLTFKGQVLDFVKNIDKYTCWKKMY